MRVLNKLALAASVTFDVPVVAAFASGASRAPIRSEPRMTLRVMIPLRIGCTDEVRSERKMDRTPNKGGCHGVRAANPASAPGVIGP